VLVNGRVVVQTGKVLNIDEEEIGNRLAEAASRPRSAKEEAIVQAMEIVKARGKAYYEGLRGKS
jgi:hypothetical protein